MTRTNASLVLLSLWLSSCTGPVSTAEPCNTDDDCEAGSFCAPGGCQIECRDDDDCLGDMEPEMCDERGRCVPARACESDDDCQNELFCDGIERCDPENEDANVRGCVAAAAPRCLEGQSCLEETSECLTNCEDGADADSDGHDAAECGGNDCDDSDARRFTDNVEICDPDNIDEDCDPLTFGMRDGDNDSHYDALCCNTDVAGTRRCGDDCNDASDTVLPGAREDCNGFDDNCDGQTDEVPESLALCTAPANSAATCVGGGCSFSCNGGFHPCGTGCVSVNSIDSCGTSCTPCVPPANSVARCDGTQCGFSCNGGYHQCGAGCSSNFSTGSCGTSCTACTPPSNSIATCNGTACGFTCNGGFHQCGSACASNTSTASCGTSCTACPVPANSTATCNGTSCGYTCISGRGDCTGGSANGCETNLTSDSANCSQCGQACAAHLRCNSSACTLGTWWGATHHWLDATTLRGQIGTATFNVSNGYSWAYQDSTGTSNTASGSFAIGAGNTVAAMHGSRPLTGQLSRRGDVFAMMDTVSNPLRYQSIWIRKSTNHTVANLAGDWYLGSFGDINNGALGMAAPFSGSGNVHFTAAGATQFNLVISFGGTDTSTGTATVAADGAVSINSSFGGQLRGQINEYNDVIILVYDTDQVATNGFRPGLVLLVKKTSGLSSSNVQGTYFLTHMVRTYRTVWGTAVAGVGAFTGGTLTGSDGLVTSVCAAGSSITVGGTGNTAFTLPNGAGCAINSMITAWAQFPSASRSDVLVAHNADTTVESLQIWIRQP